MGSAGVAGISSHCRRVGLVLASRNACVRRKLLCSSFHRSAPGFAEYGRYFWLHSKLTSCVVHLSLFVGEFLSL